MTAPLEDAVADPRQTIVELEQRLRELTTERDEALAQQAATAEILQIINRSSGDATPVFEAIVERAMRLCDAPFGGLLVPDGEFIKYLTFHNVPQQFTNFLTHNRVRARTMFGPNWATGATFNLADLSQSEGYRRRIPVTVSAVEDGGIRTMLLVPMMREGAFVGAFTVYRQEVRPFTDRQIAIAQSFADQAVIAIENARLLTELRESLERQTAMSEILAVISATPGQVQPVFEKVLECALRLSRAHMGTISRVVDGIFTEAARIGAPSEFSFKLDNYRPPPDTPLGRMMAEKSTIRIDDYRTTEGYAQRNPAIVSLVEQGRGRSAMQVPLLKDGEVVGAMTIYRPEVRPFGDQEATLAEDFAKQAVIAIENARLLTELRESLDRQTATAEVLQVINSSPGDVTPVVDAMVEKALHLCQAVYGALAIFEDDYYRSLTTRHIPEELAAFVIKPVLVPSGSAPDQIRRGADIVHVPDITDVLPEMRTPGLSAMIDFGNARTSLWVSLHKDKAVLGFFAIYRQEVRPFSEREIDLVRNFAAQAVVAIENARLLSELRARTNDLQESLTYQTATSDVLKVISRSTFDLTPVLQYVLETAMRLCRTHAGSIFRLDGTIYRWAVGKGLDPVYEEIEKNTPITPDDGTVVGRAALRRQTVRIHDAWDDPLYAQKESARITVARTMLGVPLLREGVPIGVIAMARRIVEPFTDSEIDLVTTFADQAVIAIENARLLNELRESLEQQKAMAEVLQVINASPGNLGPVWDAMLEKAASLCDARLGLLCSYDGEAQILLASRGALPEVVEMAAKRVPIESTSSVGRLALGTYEFIHTPDITDDPVYRSGVPSRRLFADVTGARTALWVALRKDGVLIGVFILYRTEVRPFTDKQIALLQSFAAQAVIAMDNARLLNEIRQRQAELRVTFDNMGDAVIMFDGEQRLVAWNRNFLHMLDIPEEWLATPRTYGDFAAYLTERGEFGDAPPPDLGAPDRGEVRPIRYERTRPDGRVLEVRRNPIPGAAGFVFIYSDITERKQAEQSILAAREAAEHALADLKAAQANLIQSEKMASLGQLTAGIAHEIKNPLNFVNNFADLSNELLGELKETAAPAFAALDENKRAEIEETIDMLAGNLDKIAEHGRRADGIVKSMLAHSRGGTGERRGADINALVEESLNLAYHGARAQDQNFNITLERDYDQKLGPIELVPQDITRVFLNLCGNGFYAANQRRRDGEAAFRPVLKVATRDLGDAVEVRIRDNGIGIPPEAKAKLFQPFFTTKPTGEGTGLGLSISYDIVTQQHGGTIAVDSRVGDFTEFTIRLPRNRQTASRGPS